LAFVAVGVEKVFKDGRYVFLEIDSAGFVRGVELLVNDRYRLDPVAAFPEQLVDVSGLNVCDWRNRGSI
jgi:hypothetical protein